MHAEADYSRIWVALYEDVVQNGRVTKYAGYPVLVNNRHVMAPSPIPKWDVPKLHMAPYLSLFGAGREKRIYAVLLDEMTSGLDVSVQAGVLDLIQEIQRDEGVAMVIVSHDLGVVRLLCERTLVMRNGRVVEAGLTDQILEDPHHPYTQLLVSSINA